MKWKISYCFMRVFRCVERHLSFMERIFFNFFIQTANKPILTNFPSSDPLVPHLKGFAEFSTRCLQDSSCSSVKISCLLSGCPPDSMDGTRVLTLQDLHTQIWCVELRDTDVGDCHTRWANAALTSSVTYLYKLSLCAVLATSYIPRKNVTFKKRQ